MKYNLSNIMTKAWELYRKAFLKITTFGEALRRAWAIAKVEDENARIISEAMAASGIAERMRTWPGWQAEGREVIHESKNVLQVTIHDPSRGIGKTRVISFFTESQTQPVTA